ncbi:MAG: hypothetical protein RI995_646 [Bacteroidota bacterium]|jgi:hypothetical protein
MATTKENILKSISTVDKIVDEMSKVTENLINYKKEKGSTLVVMRENKIVHIKPEDL